MSYKCPFNYVGSKSQLLPVLLEIFEEYNDYVFVDLFAGGFSVGLNVKNKEVIYNDINYDLSNLIELIYKEKFEKFEKKIESLIDKYNLSKINSEAYTRLRYDFNKSRDSYLFCLLIFYSFNHQIRYNQNNEFNTPFGKNRSSYNKNIKKNMNIFFSLIKKKNIKFFSKHFSDIHIDKDQIYYIDPPYLITSGSYNDGNRGISSWDDDNERELYLFLDKLNDNKIKFVLSNMLVKNDIRNEILERWRQKYNTITVETKYRNYHRHNSENVEILVKNF